MSYVWSPDMKFSTWRKLWIALATAEKELGLNITDEQIAEMKAHIYDINYEFAEAKEKELRHDVMSHVHAFGELCPKAMPIIHLGATSCYVGDNTDLIQIREASHLILDKLVRVINALRNFSDKYRDLPTLGFTHYQPAQLVTVGKRATLWNQDLVMDLENLEYQIEHIPFRGVKGTTGTQASFMELFNGDHDKVIALDKRVCELMGFKRSIAVSGQTYTRKADYYILTVLSGIAASLYKMAGDIRLLANLKEMEEPFGKNQIGSSAMAYKRNPMRCERICSLARYVIADAQNAPMTAMTQWLERTLDDSANRRISLPEAFLATDGVLRLVQNVTKGLHVNEKIVEKLVWDYLPFIATENLMMAAVKRGGDRQQLHEIIREASMAETAKMKNGESWDLVAQLAARPEFGMRAEEIRAELTPSRYIGRCPEQVAALTAVCRARIGSDAQSAEEITL